MPTSTIIDSCSNDTYDLVNGHSFWGTVTGTVASSTTQVHTGLRSIKITWVSAGNSYINQLNVLADAGRRVSFYFLFDTTPTGGHIINPVEVDTAGNAICFGVTLTTANKLAIYNTSLVDVATGTTTLTPNTWNRISVTYTITSASVNSITVYLNGIAEVTATNIAVTTSSNQIYFGYMETTSTSNNGNIYYSDLYTDNGSSGDTGDIRVTAKRPFANGTTNGFTTQIGVGGSGYGTGHASQVNERPDSTTNGWSKAVTGVAITEEYNIEGKAVGDIDLTNANIVDYNGWLIAQVAATETAQMVLNGVTSSIVFSTTGLTYFNKIAGATAYPAGTGTDIGIVTATTSTTVSLYEAGIMIAYTPAATLGSLSLLGMGM